MRPTTFELNKIFRNSEKKMDFKSIYIIKLFLKSFFFFELENWLLQLKLLGLSEDGK